MKLAIASDHAGYNLKTKIIKKLQKENIDIIDIGTSSEKSVDYPDYAFKLGKIIANKEAEYGIAICGSGIGISIACNKVKGIRCAKVNNVEECFYTRNDNDSNIIAFSSKLSVGKALKFIKKFITTEASQEERHIRRITKIKEYEGK